MEYLIKISFVTTLVYLITLTIRVAIAGNAYDVEKKKIDKDYNKNHSVGKFGTAFFGHFVIPITIHDDDSKMVRQVSRYNRLTKIFWVSILIGVPLLIYLGRLLNKT